MQTPPSPPTTWKSAAHPFPVQDERNIRGLAISAAWSLQMLQTPVKSPRKLPGILRVLPVGQPNGFVVVEDEKEKDAGFHGSPKTGKCPFS